MDSEWDKLPMYIGCQDIQKLGFKKDIVYRWFNQSDFPPMIRSAGKKVNKYKFREWLEKLEVTANEC